MRYVASSFNDIDPAGLRDGDAVTVLLAEPDGDAEREWIDEIRRGVPEGTYVEISFESAPSPPRPTRPKRRRS